MNERTIKIMSCLLLCAAAGWSSQAGLSAMADGERPASVPAGSQLTLTGDAQIEGIEAMRSPLSPLWRPYRFKPQKAFVMRARSFGGPTVNGLPAHVESLLSLAQAGQWERLADAAVSMGIDGEAITTEPRKAERIKPDLTLAFGGALDPVAKGASLVSQLKRMKRQGYDCPVLLVEGLLEDWAKTYDAAFKDIKLHSKPPILAICVGKMTLTELLNIPAFLRRYEGQYHSIIANYDLTNAHVRGRVKLRTTIARVALALEMINRASSAAYVWLGVDYLTSPPWRDWIGSQNKGRFSAVVLIGKSANQALIHPEVAKVIRQRFTKQLGAVPVGLAGLSHYYYDRHTQKNDDYGLEKYKALRKGLADAGMAFLHVQEKLQ